MTKVVILKEYAQEEKRVAITPAYAQKMVQMGVELSVEQGLGESCFYSDRMYEQMGAKVVSERKALLQDADVVFRISRPSLEEIDFLKPKTLHVSFLDPFNQKELIERMNAKQINGISLEMIPRISRAQKMDVLSSQASLAGYVAVILASQKFGRVLPMMMTPAGTLSPAKVFVIGVGVAGLQAIATAKRLGAQVSAFDTRPVVEEQVRSLGAKFVKIDLGDTGETQGGYAKELTAEQIQKQRELIARTVASSDIVITTAQVFGKRAPVIVTRSMLEQMHPGSIVLDMAVESGGNVEGSVAGEEIQVGGVLLVGTRNLPSHVAVHASQMLASNLFALFEVFWDEKGKTIKLDIDDEIIQSALVTKGM